MGRHGTHGYTSAFLASGGASFQTKIFLSEWALRIGSLNLKVFKIFMINQYFIIHSIIRSGARCGSGICIFFVLSTFLSSQRTYFLKELIFEWIGFELWLSGSERFPWCPWLFQIIHLHVIARPRACCRSGICKLLYSSLFLGHRRLSFWRRTFLSDWDLRFGSLNSYDFHDIHDYLRWYIYMRSHAQEHAAGPASAFFCALHFFKLPKDLVFERTYFSVIRFWALAVWIRTISMISMIISDRVT